MLHDFRPVRLALLTAIVACGSLCGAYGHAESAKSYGPGASDTSIKIGNTAPYSGPLSSNAAVPRTEAAYFRMINDNGGINGRRIDFISYDDAYSPPKTVEQTRKLIESDDVLFLFNQLGTPTTGAVIKYVNGRKVPQLFLATGATTFGDAKTYPWSMVLAPSYQAQTRIFGQYIARTYPDAKIAVLLSNDDFGRDNIKGLKDGLGDKVGNIVVEAAYETGAPTVDSELLRMKSSGADVFVNFASAKFAAQAIKKAAELNWRPVHILHGNSQSISAVLKPAGLENAKGLITANYTKDPEDPAWKDDAGMKRFLAFLTKYLPNEDVNNAYVLYGYNAAQAMAKVLAMCGDNLTRENVMRQAESLKDVELDLLLPSIRMSTSPTDHFPIEQMQLQRFDGQRWVGFGSVVDASGPIRSQ